MHGYAEPSWGERVANAWGHHAAELLSVSILAAIYLGVRPPSGPTAFTVPIALLVFVLGSWLLMRQHDRGLCEKCMSSMPLNAAEAASRYERRFWMAHTGSERRFLIPYLAVLIGSNFTTTTYGRIGWAVVQLSMVYLILSQATHRRLQPWCPWCSDGGGGEEIDDTPPVLPSDDRQRA